MGDTASKKQDTEGTLEPSEMRRFKRRKLALDAEILLSDGTETNGTVENISAGGALINTESNVELDDLVTVRIEHMGQFKATVRRIEKTGFAIEFDYRRDRAARLADKITCLSNNPEHQPNRRAEERTPTHYPSTMTLSDGRTLPCVVIDTSTLGAAVAISPVPRVGSKLLLADKSAVVVRTGDGIVGLRFYPTERK